MVSVKSSEDVPKRSRSKKSKIVFAVALGALVIGSAAVAKFNSKTFKVPEVEGATLLGCAAPQSNVWQTYSFSTEKGTFTAEVDATPNAAITDALVGLSNSVPHAYTDLAAIVRFGSAKQMIDARNGATYSAASAIPYVAGKTYHIRLVVNVPAHTYSAYVTPSGGVEQVIGTNLGFRTGQTTVSSLTFWTPFSDVQTFQVCNWTITSPVTTSTPSTGSGVDTQAPSVPQNVGALATSNSQINVSWSASTDNVGVAGYNVFQDGRLVVTTKNLNTSYVVTGLVAPSIHSYTVSAYDAALNVSAASALALGKISASTTTTPTPTPIQIPPPISTPVPTGSGSGGAYDQGILTDHPVAFWDLNPKSTTESDLAGGGNTGTYKSGLPSAATMPNGDKAADFNGSSQYLTVPSSRALSVPTTGNLTWEAWIRPDTLQFPIASGDGYVDFMGKCDQYGPTCEWESRMYSLNTAEGRPDRLSAYIFNPSAGLGSAADWQPVNGIISANQWVHVVGEYSTQTQPSGCSSATPGSINIWVNGVKWSQSSHAPTGCMSQYSVVPTAGPSTLNIGTMAFDTWFKGAIGKVAVYNYLLSPTQITNHYQAMTGKQPTGSCGQTCSF